MAQARLPQHCWHLHKHAQSPCLYSSGAADARLLPYGPRLVSHGGRWHLDFLQPAEPAEINSCRTGGEAAAFPPYTVPAVLTAVLWSSRAAGGQRVPGTATQAPAGVAGWLLSGEGQLLKLALHEDRVQAGSKISVPVAKTWRHVKHFRFEGVKKHGLVKVEAMGQWVCTVQWCFVIGLLKG